MKRVNRLGIIAVLAVGTVLAPAFARNVTVGRFYTELANAKGLVSVDAASAEANLRGAGFKLPKLALDKSLTEADMASISNSVGVPVTTQRPSEAISEAQMSNFMSSFGGQITSPDAKVVGTPTANEVDCRNHGGGNGGHGGRGHHHDHDSDHHHHHRSTADPD